MKILRLSTYIIIALFTISIFTLTTTNAQDNLFINYLIKPDGTIEPDNSVITRIGNNYALTQNINGTVTIQKNHAVFDGAGYTLAGNAVKGSYNLNDNLLYLEAGFNLTNAWNVTVKNVRIENCVNGISLVNAYYCRILNCTIIENAVDGMKIAWSSNNSIVWNEFISNGDDAIQLINAQNNNIMVNNLTSGAAYRINGNGFQLNGNCSNNIIKGNIINTFDTGFFIDASKGNISDNIVSYNNFISNKWNGAYVAGTANIITLNNFYDNGLLSEGNNNCSGNYWNTNSSIYDESPLSAPINIEIAPEFIELPYTEPSPTNTPSSPRHTTTPTAKPTKTNSPTATPNETIEPSVLPTPTLIPDAESAQTSANLPSLLIVTVIVSIAALVFVPLVLKGKIKSSNTKL
ncbi:MAG TPA: right-handed parallel beta-helix repeat-containing protein [Candidatus Acidoferrales bacterium]|nr:right-handed parallel beta-helix repeat-containing protein [Candidatus Acidoferrales bacterium]